MQGESKHTGDKNKIKILWSSSEARRKLKVLGNHGRKINICSATENLRDADVRGINKFRCHSTP